MLKKEEFKDKWCPLARLSIQKMESGGVKAVATGAFNQVLLSDTQQIYLTPRCVGEKCPFYRQGINPWSWGQCLMAKQQTGKYIIGAALIISMALFLLKCFCDY